VASIFLGDMLADVAIDSIEYSPCLSYYYSDKPAAWYDWAMRVRLLLSCVLSALLVTACGDAESAEHQRKHSIPAGIFDRLAGGASRRARRSYW
jgi:hypothetical protein